MKKRILFVLHDAALMGAPMVLLHLTRWIKENTSFTITVLFKDGGPLLQEFKSLGDVFVWRPGQLPGTPGRRVASKINRLITKTPLYIPYPKKLRIQTFNLIYLNTADTTALAPILKTYYKCPIIAHIHELSFSLQAYFPDALNDQNKAVIDYYIAASNGVAANLEEKHRVATDKIFVVNEFIPVNKISRPTIAPAGIRAELGIAGKFIVGGSGSAGWRKGTDLFLQLAYLVNQKLPINSIIFLWVGNQTAEMAAQSGYEIEKAGLEDRVIFTGSKLNPQDYFQVFDIFALTSREDPFPLVALEAMALKKPVFCFKGSGGIPEIITDETGKTFDYGNVDGMAEGIIEAYREPEATKLKGENAYLMVKNYDVNVLAPKISGLISTYAN